MSRSIGTRIRGVAMELVTAKKEIGAVLDAVTLSSMSMVVPVKTILKE